MPSERSTGESVIRGCITKAGNRRARRILVEAAWSYRHPPRVGKEKQKKVEAVPRTVREIAWKAQTRLCGRFRKLTRKGKLSTTVTTAVARELSAFIWAINREPRRKHAASKNPSLDPIKHAVVLSSIKARPCGWPPNGRPALSDPARAGLENERAETKKRAIKPNKETVTSAASD